MFPSTQLFSENDLIRNQSQQNLFFQRLSGQNTLSKFNERFQGKSDADDVINQHTDIYTENLTNVFNIHNLPKGGSGVNPGKRKYGIKSTLSTTEHRRFKSQLPSQRLEKHTVVVRNSDNTIMLNISAISAPLIPFHSSPFVSNWKNHVQGAPEELSDSDCSITSEHCTPDHCTHLPDSVKKKKKRLVPGSNGDTPRAPRTTAEYDAYIQHSKKTFENSLENAAASASLTAAIGLGSRLCTSMHSVIAKQRTQFFEELNGMRVNGTSGTTPGFAVSPVYRRKSSTNSQSQQAAEVRLTPCVVLADPLAEIAAMPPFSLERSMKKLESIFSGVNESIKPEVNASQGLDHHSFTFSHEPLYQTVPKVDLCEMGGSWTELDEDIGDGIRPMMTLKGMPDLLEDDTLESQRVTLDSASGNVNEPTTGSTNGQRVNNKKNKKGNKKKDGNGQLVRGGHYQNGLTAAATNSTSSNENSEVKKRTTIGNGKGGVVDGFSLPRRGSRMRRKMYNQVKKQQREKTGDDFACFFCEYEQEYGGRLWNSKNREKTTRTKDKNAK
ncbi:hypothetical protein HK096_005798, partial [Nowakowskiella sp. JEL0078]